MDKLFETALEIAEPYYIQTIDLVDDALNVFLRFRDNTKFVCPRCNKKNLPQDVVEIKRKHDQKFFKYKTFLHIQIPQVQCPDCGKQLIIPEWIPKNAFLLFAEVMASRFTN